MPKSVISESAVFNRLTSIFDSSAITIDVWSFPNLGVLLKGRVEASTGVLEHTFLFMSVLTLAIVSLTGASSVGSAKKEV